MLSDININTLPNSCDLKAIQGLIPPILQNVSAPLLKALVIQRESSLSLQTICVRIVCGQVITLMVVEKELQYFASNV